MLCFQIGTESLLKEEKQVDKTSEYILQSFCLFFPAGVSTQIRDADLYSAALYGRVMKF